MGAKILRINGGKCLKDLREIPFVISHNLGILVDLVEEHFCYILLYYKEL